MDGGASVRGTRCGRLAPAMSRCECAETPFAEVGRRLAPGRSLDEVQVETGVGLLCTACLPDLHAYLAGQPADVIYFPWNSAAISYVALFDLGIPVLVSCRGSQVNVGPHNPGRTELRDGLRVTLSRAAGVHCVSKAIETEAKAYGLDPDKDVQRQRLSVSESADALKDGKVDALFWTGGLPTAAIESDGGIEKLTGFGLQFGDRREKEDVAESRKPSFERFRSIASLLSPLGATELKTTGGGA